MATFGLVASMAAHAFWKCASPSSLDKLESSSVSSLWACSALTNFFRVLICLVNHLIDFKLEIDLSSSESFFAWYNILQDALSYRNCCTPYR